MRRDGYRRVLAVGSMGALVALASGCNVFSTEADGSSGGYAGYDAGVTAIPSPSPAPVLGQTVSLAKSPPSISGGTLLIAADGHTAVAADSDRDAVFVVDTATAGSSTGAGPKVVKIALAAGAEPGRVVQDGLGLIHVVLRGAGAIADIDPVKGVLLGTRQVCPAPRGIAFDPSSNHLVVACTGGELVTLASAANGAVLNSVTVQDDLRDVVLMNGSIFVSRFRSAELLQLDSAGALVATTSANGGTTLDDFTPMNPSTAWRTVPMGTTGIAMVHQLARENPVPPTPGSEGYYTQGDPACGTAIVASTVTFFDTSGHSTQPQNPTLTLAVLPVDIAVSPDQTSIAVVAAGNGHTQGLPQVEVLQIASFQESTNNCEPYPSPSGDAGALGYSTYGYGSAAPTASAGTAYNGSDSNPGQPVAVAFDSQNRAIAQTREPATLYFVGSTAAPIILSLDSVEDTGHAIFHSNSGGNLACASCHAEGGDDGHVWGFTEGTRRTQSLRGTIQGTAPYHWGGDLSDISSLVQEVYVTRMSGNPLAADQTAALQSFVFAVAPPALSTPTGGSVASGAALFQDPTVGCATCHNGPKYTNNATVDVGTGGPFQVPSLVGVAWRAPYLHTGCANTLADRFNASLTSVDGSCTGGDQHGHWSQLSQSQVNDLVAYLQTL